MALVIKDRVRERTTTTGTGTLTLTGAVTGYQSFSAIGNANTTYYAIVGVDVSSEWEVGLGTYTSAGTLLSRDTVLSSSNSNAAVSFSAGTKDVFVVSPAVKSPVYDASGNFNATTATTLQTGRTINGVTFDGSINITVTAAAGTLTGTTLAATVVTSSLTAVGTITTGVWTGTAVDATHGGTNQTTWTTGDLLYASASNTLAKLAGNITTTRNFLRQVGSGAASAAPGWDTLAAGDIPSLDASKITTGNLDYARLPTGSGYWDVGVIDNYIDITNETIIGTAVLHDATSSGVSTTAQNSINWSHTVGSFNNRILVVFVSMRETDGSGADTVNTVTFGAVTLTFLGAASRNSARVEIWYLLSPAVGTDTITITLAGVEADRLVGGSSSYYNVASIGTIGTNTGSGLTATAAITSASGDLVVAAVSKLASTESIVSDTAQTERYNTLSTAGGDAASNRERGSGGSKTGTAASTVSLTWTWSTTNRSWAVAGVALKPAARAQLVADYQSLDVHGAFAIDETIVVTRSRVLQNVTANASIITAGTFAEARGGTNQSTYTTGDVLYASATNVLSKLGIGAANRVLTSSGTIPQWSANIAYASLPTGAGSWDAGSGNLITITRTLTVSGAMTLSSTLSYGGVTLSAAVTGTGNMVLSAGPTLTGTLTAAIANLSGLVTLTGTDQLKLAWDGTHFTTLKTDAGGLLAIVPTGGTPRTAIQAGALIIGSVAPTLSATGDLEVQGAILLLGTAAAQTGSNIELGGTTQTTIGANGAASALTANPLGYLIAYKGATKIVIPYYNA